MRTTIINNENQTILLSSVFLIQKIGRSTAQFVYQLHYWIEKKQGVIINNTRWIYNTAIEWAKQIGISSRQIERIIQKLKTLNLIHVEHFGKTNRINYITINYETLNQLFNEKNNDKTSEKDRQNVGMYNKETKINNKEKYKSEENNQNTNFLKIQSSSSQRVEHVPKNNFICDKIEISKSNPIENYKTFIQTEEQKPTITQDMLLLWNNRFKNSQTKLNKELSRNLVAAFKHKFNSNLELWDNYLKRIESSSYLMSKDFSLSLYWALKFTIIDRIGQGEFGVKDVQRAVSQDELNIKLEEHFDELNESEPCKDIRRKIAKIIGSAAYLSWFTKVVFVINTNCIQFKAQTPFVNDYIMTHYGYLLSK